MIAKMALDIGVCANIMGASTKTIGGMAYGNMLLGIPGGKEEVEKAVRYLKSVPDIAIEEVKDNA